MFHTMARPEMQGRPQITERKLNQARKLWGEESIGNRSKVQLLELSLGPKYQRVVITEWVIDCGISRRKRTGGRGAAGVSLKV
jgi:hypothetical protein